MTWASRISPSSVCSFCSFPVARVFRSAVRWALRPVNTIVMALSPLRRGPAWASSTETLASLVRRRAAQLLAVLGDGSPGDAQPLAPEDLHDGGVGQRVPR